MKAGSPGTPGPAGTRKQSGSEDLDKVFFMVPGTGSLDVCYFFNLS